MSKKLKAIICALTAGMMLFTSSGLSVFAEELNSDGSAAATETKLNADGSEAVATEQPETVGGADVAEDEKDAEVVADIEASQATQEPEATPVPKGYDADTYYQNALQVVSALGIITGYDDGSIKPESTVTRAEMATIILRMIAVSGTSAYQNVFTDVQSSHWAADTIQTAVEQSIVDGMGDGTFVPDGPVKYEQVIKMIVCAMNYGVDAENAGGYPTGYVSIGGGTLKLLTGVSGTTGEDMPRGEVIKSVYNALKASYRDIKEFKNGYPVYEKKDTLGIEKFKMYEEEGFLTTTPNINIAPGSKTVEGMITIDGVDYKCDFDVDKYVASKVKFYYIDDKNDNSRVIAMFSKGQSEEHTFKAEDIESIDINDTIKVYNSSTSSATKKYTIKGATVVYNDSITNVSEYNAFKNTSYYKAVNSKAMGRGDTYNDFLTPKTGTVRIVDYEEDGTFDIMFVDSYDTMLVTNATTEKLTGKINNSDPAVAIEYDLDDKAYEINVTKNDVKASVKNLKKNDVASIKRNIAGDKMTIVVTGENITGSVSSISSDDDEMTVTINGQTYKVDENMSKRKTSPDTTDIKSGVSGTFYLDMFDRIGYVNLENILSEGENYAMLTKVFYNDENDLVVRLYTQEGKEIEVKPSSNINAWLPGAKASSHPDEATMYAALGDVDRNDDGKIDSKDESQYVQAVDGDNSYPVKLCTYKLNNAGELTKLFVAVGKSTTDSNSALTVLDDNGTKKASLKDTPAIGGTVAGYSINDGIVEFSVPDDYAERSNASNYSSGAVTASNYKSYDGGVGIVYAIGSFQNGRYPQALVRFTTSATSLYKLSDVDTASSRPGMIVSRINHAVDDEGENIFEVVGYQNGSEVSYMTTSHSGLYKFTGFNERDYGGTLLYDATEDSPSVFTENLHVGDIVYVSANGANANVLIKVVDINELAKVAAGKTASGLLQWPGGHSAKDSSTRFYYYMGFVSRLDLEDSAFIGLRDFSGDNTGNLTYNPSTVFSYATINIDSTGSIKGDVKVDKSGGMEASELIPYADDATEFDYGVFNSLKGNMGSGFVIRINRDFDED